jgi:hypothetical protein
MSTNKYLPHFIFFVYIPNIIYNICNICIYDYTEQIKEEWDKNDKVTDIK